MRHPNLIAGILAACIASADLLEVPLAHAEILSAEHTAFGMESETLPSEPLLPAAANPVSAPIPEERTSSVAPTKAKTTKTSVRSRTQSGYSKKRSRSKRFARYSSKKSAAKVAKTSAKSSSRTTSKLSVKSASKKSRSRTNSRASRTYRSSKSSRKKYYSRYHGKRSRSGYARRHRSSKPAPVNYARVSDAVRGVGSSLAQNWHETLKDVEIMPGVRYKHYIISTGNKHSVHVLEVDRTKPEVGITLFKGQNLANGLERITDIAARTDSSANGILQGLINASFWKSNSNAPIGPTIINGEVLEMGQHKEWSACFFDRQNRMYIERFNISGMVKLKTITLDIDKINRRVSKEGIVVYNHFAGKDVPVQPPLQVEMLMEGDAAQASTDELSDTKTNKNDITRTIAEQRRGAEYERSLRKAVVLYSGQPSVNEDIACRVIEVDTGAVNIPQNGLVISFGENIESDDIPKPGDKISLQFKTNLFSSIPFVQAVSGTPRLVNRGIARHEAEYEGARGERFVSQKLPRTAVGMDATGTILYFVTTEGTATENGTTGMTMQQLAEGMKQLGSYHAMSLDGSASSAMVVRGGVNETIGSQRKISVALGIMRQTGSDRFSQPRRRLITKPTSGMKPDKQDSTQGSPASDIPTPPEKSNGNGNSNGIGMVQYGPNGKD
jgi:Phosphodiester glycosidase